MPAEDNRDAALSVASAETGPDMARAPIVLTRGVEHKARNVVLLLLVGVLWGMQPALIKALTDRGVGEIPALWAVMTAVTALLGIILVLRQRLFVPSPEILKFMVLSGIAEFVAPLLVTFLVASHVDAGLLTLIIATTPVFTIPLAAAVGSEPLERRAVAACLVGLLAMVLIVAPEDALPRPDMLPWCLAAFLIPVIYSCGSVYVSHAWPLGFDALQVAFGGGLMSVAMLAPFGLGAIGDGSLPAMLASSWPAFAAIVLAVVVEMVLYYHLLQKAGPVFTSFSSFIMIASGFVAGALVFGERPSGWIWMSVALFTLSLALIIRPGRR